MPLITSAPASNTVRHPQWTEFVQRHPSLRSNPATGVGQRLAQRPVRRELLWAAKMLSAVQRLALAGRSGLGFLHPATGIAAAAVAGAAASGSSRGALWLRNFSEEAGSSDKPAEKPAQAAEAGGSELAAAASEAAEAAAAPAEEQQQQHQQQRVPAALIDPEDGSVVPPELFSKRQLAWMGLDGQPGKYKHFLPRLSRKERGSFADQYVSEEFEMEQEMYPTVPEDQPLYDLRKVVPEMYDPRSDLFERLRRLKQERHAGMSLDQFVREVVGIDLPEEQPPRPGARKIIRWEVRHVLSVGVNEGHPANKKVKAYVYLRDLQREHGLTEAALQHIAAIAGPRYHPNTGVLKLTSDKHPHREANRAHILQMLNDLVKEGQRKHPAAAEQPAVQQQLQQATAA